MSCVVGLYVDICVIHKEASCGLCCWMSRLRLQKYLPCSYETVKVKPYMQPMCFMLHKIICGPYVIILPVWILCAKCGHLMLTDAEERGVCFVCSDENTSPAAVAHKASVVDRSVPVSQPRSDPKLAQSSTVLWGTLELSVPVQPPLTPYIRYVHIGIVLQCFLNMSSSQQVYGVNVWC